MARKSQQQPECDRGERPVLTTDADVQDKLEWFYWFDKDNNDQLDEEELRKVFQALCWDPTDEEFKEIMTKCDLDKNGLISKDEYLHLLNTFRPDPDEVDIGLRESFRHFDRDRSGKIDKTEMKRILLAMDMVFTDRDQALLDKMFGGKTEMDVEEFIKVIKERPIKPEDMKLF